MSNTLKKKEVFESKTPAFSEKELVDLRDSIKKSNAKIVSWGGRRSSVSSYHR